MPRHPKEQWEQHFSVGSKLGKRGLKACSMRKQSAQGRSIGWRSKKGHIFLLTLSWKVDEDICNGACYGKPMGYKFSSKTLSQLERYVLHNEVLQMTFHWKPCSIFSLFLSLSVPVQKPGAAPRNICCQLRITVCSFEGLSHGPPKLLMTLQLQAELGSKKVFS